MHVCVRVELPNSAYAPALRCRGSARGGHTWPAMVSRGKISAQNPWDFHGKSMEINRMVCSDSVKHPKKSRIWNSVFVQWGPFQV